MCRDVYADVVYEIYLIGETPMLRAFLIVNIPTNMIQFNALYKTTSSLPLILPHTATKSKSNCTVNYLTNLHPA